MALAAFGSGTERSVADASRSGRAGAHPRSSSLCRYSGWPPSELDEFQTSRTSFVNKVRGSGLPEISVDDLTEEFFMARAESDEDSEPFAASTQRRRSVASYLMETESSRQRGRSVSKPPDRRPAPSKGVPDSFSRRRRSLSVARRRRSDSECDMDFLASSIHNKLRISGSSTLQQPSSRRPGKKAILLRSMSQKDCLHSQSSYSSHSSSLTDGEAHDICLKKSGDEKTIQTVYVQEKVKAINEPIGIVSSNDIELKSSEVLQAIAKIKRNYTAKLEQSEKRKQDLLVQLAMEEKRGQELCKIVKELLPSPKKSVVPLKESTSRRRSNDRTRMSKCLTEEAEKYFEDFLINVEDTDISSFDGERSDTSSSVRCPGLYNSVAETPESLSISNAGLHNSVAERPESWLKTDVPLVDGDGLRLPWLQWETSMGPSPCKIKRETTVSSGNILTRAAVLPVQQASASAGFNNCSQTASSFGGWSSGGNESSSLMPRESSKRKSRLENHLSGISASRTSASSFDMVAYMKLKQDEDQLFERLKQRQRIESGSMILCGQLMAKSVLY